jgi:hypothetical protein
VERELARAHVEFLGQANQQTKRRQPVPVFQLGDVGRLDANHTRELALGVSKSLASDADGVSELGVGFPTFVRFMSRANRSLLIAFSTRAISVASIFKHKIVL